MLDVADLGRSVGLRHFLLGGSPEVLRDLERSLTERFPGIEIVGTCSPPYRQATDDELCDRDDEIRASGAQVVWVGLGTPKQDVESIRLAASMPILAVAVGAAFDYAAGRLRPAPHWVSVAGFEWLWRFAAEPKRLWKRYTSGNARFVRAAIASELGASRTRRREGATSTTVVGQLPPPLHGSAVMTERLVEALRRNGESVSVVDRRFSRSVGEVGRPGVRKVLAIPSLAVRFMASARRSGQVVLLITCTPGSFLIDHLLLRLTRKPVVLYIHTVGFHALADRGRIWSRLVRWSFGRAQRVVVLGDTLVQDVAAFVSPERISVVPNSAPAGAFRSHTSGHRVLFLSNLLPGKGADVFVRVAHDLVGRRPGTAWRFDLAGAGDAAALGPLPAEITVHGAVGGRAKNALLRGADVLLVPSTYALEAQPLVIVEALSYGLPVIAYDTGGIRDLVDDTVGALIAQGDEAALSDAVLGLLESPDRLRSARTAARARYDSQHSPRAYRDAWREVLPTRAPASARAEPAR